MTAITEQKRYQWSIDEITLLSKLAKEKEHEEIAKILGRSRNAVRSKCHKLGIRKKEKEWTVEEYSKIHDAYASGGYVDTVEFAKSLGRSLNSVHVKVSRLGY